MPSALIAAALSIGETSRGELEERVRRLSRLFKYEFMFRADATFEAIFDDAMGRMVAAGELELEGDEVRVGAGEAGERVATYAAMMRSYFEAYLLAARAGDRLLAGEGELTQRDWIKRTMDLGQRMYLAGEFELRESISKHKLENALKSFKDLGLVVFGAMSTVHAAHPGQGEFAQLRDELAKFLE